MKKEVYLFGNSMCYTPIGESYLDLLKEEYDVKGLWMRGMTVWHINKYAKGIIKGEDIPIIINVGVSDSTTRNSIHFLYYWLNEAVSHGIDSFYESNLIPIMRKAVLNFENKIDLFYPLIPIDLFGECFIKLLLSLQECKAIVVELLFLKMKNLLKKKSKFVKVIIRS